MTGIVRGELISIRARSQVINELTQAVAQQTDEVTKSAKRIEEITAPELRKMSKKKIKKLIKDIGFSQIKKGNGATKTGSHERFADNASSSEKVILGFHSSRKTIGRRQSTTLAAVLNKTIEKKRAKEKKEGKEQSLAIRKCTKKIVVNGKKQTTTRNEVNFDAI